MESNAEALARVIAEMSKGMADSGAADRIAGKIANGKATYADALAYAQESGRVITKSLKKNIQKVLTDGKLYREAAETVIKEPMQIGAADVIDIAAEIQDELNELAGIGIQAIRPDINADQIDGIITGICNAENYAAGENTLMQQIANFLEGTVDDCVRENADFHYNAGLSPKIERRADAKCCSWCSALAGVYDYADVKNAGNDVYKRHNNCHCQVLYNPGDGSKRRQNVHTRSWEDDRAERIAKAEAMAEERKNRR